MGVGQIGHGLGEHVSELDSTCQQRNHEILKSGG